MSSFHVGGKVVDKVDLLKKKHWTWRFDVWPFVLLHAVWIAVIVPSLDFVDAAIVFGAIVASHILVWLFTAWSVDFGCFAHYSKVAFLVIVIAFSSWSDSCDVYRQLMSVFCISG